MKTRPYILVTNDDGIHAPGIKHLWNALKDIADIAIAAPAAEQSSVGLSITIRHPLRIEEIIWPESGAAWSVNGTPADCVKLALKVILKKIPDLIVSGINKGSNAGHNILYSGTVGGAIEGVMQGIPSIAFSCYDYQNPHYPPAEPYISKIVQHVLEHPLPAHTLLNVNFPSRTNGAIKGFKMTRHGKEFWAENPAERYHPNEGHSYYWLGAKVATFKEEEDCDITWLKQGYATAVPIYVGELTHAQHLDERRPHFEKLFSQPHLSE